MIDVRNPNYADTLLQIDELKSSIEKLEKNLYFQIPQGLNDKFASSKNTLLNWVEEIEFTLEDYKK